jgi:hypothetical protein
MMKKPLQVDMDSRGFIMQKNAIISLVAKYLTDKERRERA